MNEMCVKREFNYLGEARTMQAIIIKVRVLEREN